MTETREQFCQRHLNGVSRSFAACIGRLNQPLRDYVGLTYLLCRVLDSIEDGLWSTKNKQTEAFRAFEFFMLHGELPENFHLDQLPEGLSLAEINLITESQRLFSEVSLLPGPIRKIIIKLAVSMGRGMQYFSAGQELHLKSLSEVNRYCYFVAGTVGEALTALAHHVDSNLKLDSSMIRDSHHFGLFLQKVNLLKDQSGDEKEGRYLVPSKAAVYESLKKNTEGAWAYIQRIPESLQSYKIFCSWSFFVGLKTLPYLMLKEDSFKLPRDETLKLFQMVEESVKTSPEALSKLYKSLFAQADFSEGVETTPLESGPQIQWFLDNYMQVIEAPKVEELHRQELCFGV